MDANVLMQKRQVDVFTKQKYFLVIVVGGHLSRHIGGPGPFYGEFALADVDCTLGIAGGICWLYGNG